VAGGVAEEVLEGAAEGDGVAEDGGDVGGGLDIDFAAGGFDVAGGGFEAFVEGVEEGDGLV